ncbi:MAG: HPr family phosphocarrier protein [Christensenellales bacterium]|jgi:phosphocarrier protein HPr
MVSEQVKIINPTGLHARPASVFVKAANGFRSDVAVISGDKRINAKSIVKVMSTALKQGTDIVIEASGEDEAEAVRALVDLVKGGFGEV